MTEHGNEWVKSSLSFANGNCVEVLARSGSILVRNSRYPDGGVLVFTLAEWAAFIGGAKGGEFDRFCYRARLTQCGNGGWELWWDNAHVATLGGQAASVAAQAWANFKVDGGDAEPWEWVNLGGGPDAYAVEWFAVMAGTGPAAVAGPAVTEPATEYRARLVWEDDAWRLYRAGDPKPVAVSVPVRANFKIAQGWANVHYQGGGPITWVNLSGGPDDEADEWFADPIVQVPGALAS